MLELILDAFHPQVYGRELEFQRDLARREGRAEKRPDVLQKTVQLERLSPKRGPGLVEDVPNGIGQPFNLRLDDGQLLVQLAVFRGGCGSAFARVPR